MRFTFCIIIFIYAFTGIYCLYAQDTDKGREIYEEYCATCHGEDMNGGMAASLIDGDWQFGSKSSHHFRNIKYGISERGMPAFADALSDDDIRDVLAYVQDKEKKLPATQPNTTSVLHTLDYKVLVQVWVSGLEIPWAIDFPDTNLALVTERPGRLRIVRNGILQNEAVRNIPAVLHEGQGGLMDVAIYPDYSHNGWIYLSYSHALPDGLAMTKIVRGRIDDNTWVGQQTLFEADHKFYLNTRHHYGCRIVFDPQGYLYFSIGERGRMENAQDLSRPNGKIHRIQPDGGIPESNPFLADKEAVPSIYTYGNRNPQGLAVNPQTGRVWETEHGPMGGDELNIIGAGQNYGWPLISYGIDYDGSIITERTHAEGLTQPVLYWRPSIAVCGLDFYRGKEFPKWQNNLLVGALKYEEVRLLQIEEDRVVHEEIILKNYGRVRDVMSGPDGAIYVVLNEPGRILRLTRDKD
jgi:glucose/arabinose dehydrogenase